MSLIEDALRRVQDPVITSTTPPPAKDRAAASTAVAPAPKIKSAPQAPAPSPDPAVHSWDARPLKARTMQEAPLFMAVMVLGLTGVLAIAAAFWMGRRLNAPAAKSVAARAPAPMPVGSPSSNAASEAPVPLAEAPLAPSFSLSGIVEGLGQPCAMINAVIVCLGERVGGSSTKLVDVGDRAVTLEQPDGSTLTLRLPR